VIVLDTNVISEIMRTRPHGSVIEWLDQQTSSECFITAVTLAELLYGVGRIDEGRRKDTLAAAIEAMITEDFENQVLPFDQTAAAHYADVVVRRGQIGKPISTADAQIAAICRSYKATLVTRNVKDFADIGLSLFDPWFEAVPGG
jgi:toxin FitB